jgi:hypothetical protein
MVRFWKNPPYFRIKFGSFPPGLKSYLHKGILLCIERAKKNLISKNNISIRRIE